MATRATNLLYISVSPSGICSRKPYVPPISLAKKISIILDSQVDDSFTKLTSSSKRSKNVSIILRFYAIGKSRLHVLSNISFKWRKFVSKYICICIIYF